MGIVAPVISRRSRVAHFTTGDEVIDPGLVPGRGQIRDSNGALVRAFVETMGGEMVWQERVSDDVGALTERVRAAVEGGADMVLVSGGASVGDYDFGSRAIEGAGFEVHFGRVKLRPGKPLVFATRGRQVAFVLPGNPLSHLAVLNCVVRVAFERMAGIEPELRVLNARLRVGIGVGGDGRDTLWPGRVEYEGGEAVVRALRWMSSGDITGMAGLNAFIRCNAPVLDMGAVVPCILLHG
jgi:molybdopterin molybdotransferase